MIELATQLPSSPDWTYVLYFMFSIFSLLVHKISMGQLEAAAVVLPKDPCCMQHWAIHSIRNRREIISIFYTHPNGVYHPNRFPDGGTNEGEG